MRGYLEGGTVVHRDIEVVCTRRYIMHYLAHYNVSAGFFPYISLSRLHPPASPEGNRYIILDCRVASIV